MKYTTFTRGELGYNPKYTKPLESEEVVVSPIRYSDKEEDMNTIIGYTPIYRPIIENIMDIDLPKDEGSKKEDVVTEERPTYKIITPDMIGFMGGIPVKSNGRVSQIINLGSSSSSVASGNGVDYKFSNKSEFKSKMLDVYRKVLREKGISEEFARSLVGQDALESAWGSKVSGKNNFGGIKGKGTTKRTREVINGKDVYINDSFRDFNSLEEYARYKVNLLNNSRYRAFDGDVSDFSRRVASGGYATDPRYREILDKVIKSVKKGGKVFKGNTGMVFVNESGDKSRPSVVAGVYDRNVDYDRNRETLDFIRKTNGAIRYDKKKGVATPEFWDRLRESYPRSISGINGEPMNVLMSYGEVDGKYVVYPEIQEIDGRLVRLEGDEAIDKALSSGNYVVAPNEGVARDFTKNYKAYTEHFPAFKDVKKSFTPWRTDWDAVMRDINNSGSEIKHVDNRPSSNTLSLYGDKSNEAIRIYKKLINDGYDPAQSAGLVGVFMQESSLDHSKVSDAGAKGIGQLKDAKLNKYYEWLKETGRPDNSDSQIDWIMNHVNYGKDDWKDYYYSLMENSRDNFVRLPKDQQDKARRDWALMENSKYADYDYESFRDTFYNMSLSPGEVAELFTWTFERPGEDEANIDQRKRYAEQLYYYMNPND